MIEIWKTASNDELVTLNIDEAQSGSWFNLINPTQEEIQKVSQAFVAIGFAEVSVNPP